MTLAEKACEFARARHEGQFRRDGVTPYFTHCEKVASLLDDETEKAVAYCHDLIEDGRASYEEVEQELGPMVAQNVLRLTHEKSDDYISYILRFRDPDYKLARAVKIADMVSNLSDNPTEKQIIKYHQALRILTALQE